MSHSLRIVFAGTPDFSVPCLQRILASDHKLVAVYTQPDRPAGRGRGVHQSAVKQCALEAGIPVNQPVSLRTDAARQTLAELRPDLMVVVAYGLILPQEILDLPRHGCWNVHASLLPRWRGAAPIQRAIAAGDEQTGVCLMRMEAGLDSGPVIDCQATPIEAHDTGGSLHDRLADMGAELLGPWLDRLASDGEPEAKPQDDSQACYAHKLLKAEAQLDLSRPALELARQVRAFNPWPVAQCEIAGEPVRVWSAQALRWPGRTQPGELVSASPQGLDLATGSDLLRITELQRPGGRRIQAADYLNARQDLRQGSAPGSRPDSQQ